MIKYISYLSLLFLTACIDKRKPERLLPPEPVVIEHEGANSRQDKPLPFWAQTKGDAVNKIGKPYKVNGVWYFPAENPNYDEIGLAAVYPKHFKGKRTANGEIYEHHKLTGCHKTLPLPSIVRITNLDNNRSTTIRINDRGPFVNDRLVDVSPSVAEALQFSAGQPVKVRVEVLKTESMDARNLINQPVETVVTPKTTTMTPMEEDKPDDEVVNILEAAEESAPEPTTKAPDGPTTTEDSASSEAQRDTDTEEATDPQDGGAPVEHYTPPQEAFFVQAGVFGNEANADRLAEKLAQVGDVQKTSFEAQNQSLTRVRVGPFASVGDADRALEQVKGLGISDARITTDSAS